MNSIERTWLVWRHRRKLAACGKHPNLALPHFNVEGHLELGDLTHFRNNATFRTYGNGRIIIHTRSGCSWGCLFEARARVEVERYVGIAEYCHITDSLPDLADFDGPWQEAPRITRPVVIKERAFIGSACFIGPGVTVGESAVLTPHSVLLQSIQPYEIWGGVPARRIGHRTEGLPESVLRESEALLTEQGVRLDRYIEQGKRRGWRKFLQKLSGR